MVVISIITVTATYYKSLKSFVMIMEMIGSSEGSVTNEYNYKTRRQRDMKAKQNDWLKTTRINNDSN